MTTSQTLPCFQIEILYEFRKPSWGTGAREKNSFGTALRMQYVDNADTEGCCHAPNTIHRELIISCCHHAQAMACKALSWDLCMSTAHSKLSSTLDAGSRP